MQNFKNEAPVASHHTPCFSKILKEDFISLKPIGNIDAKNDFYGNAFVPSPKVIEIETKDCLNTCFMLDDYGFKIYNTPYYTGDGLIGRLKDAFGNVYIIKETRSYDFDVLI